ncbi:CinA family protein [Oryzobacter sp. R7]|uniref:CinA family protein n=1 Tax=Oryzobacter faecalis TaxID=3388656 RepID=UPI00398D37C3
MTPHHGAAAVVADLVARGLTVGTAESLTGGLVAAALTSVPGASAVVRGGVVAYASDVKASVLGVDPVLLAAEGAVCAPVAEQLAEGVRAVLRCDVGLATTGVAGPDPADGKAVGTVFVAAAGPWGILVEEHALTGDREQVRASSVDAVLRLLGRGLHNLRAAVGGAGYGGTQHESTDDAREEAP